MVAAQGRDGSWIAVLARDWAISYGKGNLIWNFCY